MLGAVFGIGSGIGPLVGGAICTYISWHWVFYINVPLALVCFFLTISKFPSLDEYSTKRIDYTGMAVLTVFILDVLLFFQQLGEGTSITDTKMILMAAAAPVLLTVFVSIELKAEDPIIAPKLIRKKMVVIGGLYLFILGLAMIGTLTYVALFIITIYDYDTMECGLCLLPMVFGMMITAMGSGMAVRRTGYRIWIIVGSVIMVASLLLMSTLGSTSDIILLFVYTFLFGMGLGFTNSTMMIAVQNNTPREDMGMTTSTVTAMRNIGSTVGTAVFALIISTSMNSKFAETAFAPLAEQFDLSGTGLIALKYFPPIPGLADTIVSIFGESVCGAFLFAGLLYILALGMSFLIDKGKPGEE